ncbi:MAG: cell division protein SepF [Candidatus Margulisiibacteriota bacterium]
MIDIFNKAKEFIGLGPEEETMDVPLQKTEAQSVDYPQNRQKNTKKASSSDLEITIYEPKAYENSIEISARLRNGHPVIVNLKYLDSTEGTRLIDFVCGTAFAIDGHMTKIADTIFLLSPTNVSIADYSEKASSESGQAREGLLHNRL